MAFKTKAIFPKLRTEDIKVYITDITEEKGGRIILYYSGELVSIMMDEVFGPYNWSKKNNIVSVNGGYKFVCELTVYDENTGRSFTRDGLGVTTEFDPEKGEETDALKRAAFQLGIGRELKHNLPPLYFDFKDMTTIPMGANGNVKYRTTDDFVVEQVVYTDEETIDRRITQLSILNKTTGKRMLFDIKDELEKTRTKIAEAEKSAKAKEKKRGAAKKETIDTPVKTSKDYGLTVIDLKGSIEGKKLSEIAPLQVVWVYNHKDASIELREACLAYATQKENVKNEFLKQGINVN